MNHLGPTGSKPSGTGYNIGERIAPHHEHAFARVPNFIVRAPAGYELVYTAYVCQAIPEALSRAGSGSTGIASPASRRSST